MQGPGGPRSLMTPNSKILELPSVEAEVVTEEPSAPPVDAYRGRSLARNDTPPYRAAAGSVGRKATPTSEGGRSGGGGSSSVSSKGSVTITLDSVKEYEGALHGKHHRANSTSNNDNSKLSVFDVGVLRLKKPVTGSAGSDAGALGAAGPAAAAAAGHYRGTSVGDIEALGMGGSYESGRSDNRSGAVHAADHHAQQPPNNGASGSLTAAAGSEDGGGVGDGGVAVSDDQNAAVQKRLSRLYAQLERAQFWAQYAEKATAARAARAAEAEAATTAGTKEPGSLGEP